MSQSLLPLHYKNHRPTGPGGKSQVRCKEFQLIVVLLLTFVLVWVGLVTYMPDIGQPSTQFDDAYRQFTGYSDSRREFGATDFTPLQEPNQDDQRKPLELSNDKQEAERESKLTVELQTEGSEKASRTEETGKEVGKTPFVEGNGDGARQVDGSKGGPAMEHVNVNDGELGDSPKPTHRSNGSTVANNSLTEKRRAKVVEVCLVKRDKHNWAINLYLFPPQMIKHAWGGYVRYAFGENELKPVSKRGHSPVVFGKTKVGATIVDSLDTLYIVGLKEEFQQARDWVSENLNLDEVGGVC